MLVNKKATPQEIEQARLKFLKEVTADNSLTTLSDEEKEKLVNLFMIFANHRTYKVKAQLLQIEKDSKLFTNLMNKMVQRNHDQIDCLTFVKSYVEALGNTINSEGLDNVFTTITTEASIDETSLTSIAKETNITLDKTQVQTILRYVAQDQQAITREDLGAFYNEQLAPKVDPKKRPNAAAKAR